MLACLVDVIEGNASGLAPRLVLMAGAGVQHTESVSWIGGHVDLQKLDNPGVIALLVVVAQGGAGDSAGSGHAFEFGVLLL